MNDQSIAKRERSPTPSWALVGLVLVCSSLLVADSTESVDGDDWEVPMYEVPTYATHDLDFPLWNECQKIELSVNVSIYEGEHADRLGFEEEAVQTLFESRLRAARLFYKEQDEEALEEIRQRYGKALQAMDVMENLEVTNTILRRMSRIGTQDLLSVSVLGVGNAVYVDVAYRRWMDVGFGESGYATIWDKASILTHGYDKSYIMQDLSEKADAFILKYLTVNEQACEE